MNVKQVDLCTPPPTPPRDTVPDLTEVKTEPMEPEPTSALKTKKKKKEKGAKKASNNVTTKKGSSKCVKESADSPEPPRPHKRKRVQTLAEPVVVDSTNQEDYYDYDCEEGGEYMDEPWYDAAEWEEGD